MLYGLNAIIITSGKISLIHHTFTGNCIIDSYGYHSWLHFKNTDQHWNVESKKLLSPLPSILNFEIHEHEKY